VKLVEKGRKEYNTKNYTQAEELFRSALRADGRYALACLFLGNALYQQDKTDEAVHAWERAIDAEPNGSSGLKAKRKIERVGQQKEKVVHELMERIKKKAR